MNLLDLIVIVLASQTVIDVWRNGEIFADLRAYLEARMDYGDDDEEEAPSPPGPLPRLSEAEIFAQVSEMATVRPWWVGFLNRFCPDWLCHLLTCSYCMTVQVPFWLALFFFLPALLCTWLDWTLMAALCMLLPYVLAAARIIFLVDGFLPDDMRFERDREVSPPSNGS